MKKLEMIEIEKIEGGCGVEIGAGIVASFGLAAATGPIGIGLALVGFGFAMYSATQC